MLVNDDNRRELAIKRLKDKSDFRIHLVVYLTVNAMLLVIWAVTGGVTATPSGYTFGFLWPIFPIVGWGVGLIAHWYTVYFSDVYSEEQVRREMGRLP